MRTLVRLLAIASILTGCKGSGAQGTETGAGTGTSSSGGSGDGDTTGGEELGPWAPGEVFPTPGAPNERGLLDRRGFVHTHSPFSHDACDENPMPGGKVDQECRIDLREAICLVQADFMMLTDHSEFFSEFDFPTVLLYDDAFGDELIERGGAPVANRAGCGPLEHETLIMAGCESGTMPVGLEAHVAATPAERAAVYGDVSADAIMAAKAQGAISLVAHTEDWEVAQLIDLPLDGFEMYNLHANMQGNIAAALGLLAMVQNEDPGLPHPDLVIYPIVWEDPIYLERWGSVLASGARRVTTMGTDAHQNSFPDALSDGERVDSFRRMMLWFSNHILVEPAGDGTWGDLELKQGLRAGRLYGVFEYMGYAEGFDFHAQTGGNVVEMGGQASLADGVTLRVRLPSVQNLDPQTQAPELSAHLLRAVDGGWEEIDMDTQDLDVDISETGAYRAEIRMIPWHLVDHLGNYADDVGEDRVWVYANPIYVVD